MLFSGVIGYFTGRDKFWGGIDLLAPVEERSRLSRELTQDLFTKSSLETSGRTPYINFIKIFDSIIPGDVFVAMSLLSSITLTLAPTLLFLMLYFTSHCTYNPMKTTISSHVLLSFFIFIFGVNVLTRLPYTPSIYLAGFGPLASPWAAPEYLSIVLNCFAMLLLSLPRILAKTSLRIMAFLLILVGTLIHPVSSFFLILIILTFKTFFKTLRIDFLVTTLSSLCIGYLVLTLMFLSQHNPLTSPQFIQIYAELRHPHHFVPSEYLSASNVLFHLIVFLFSFFICPKSNRVIRVLILWLFSYMVFFNFMQYVSVELFKIQFLAAFGPSRINTYTLTALFVLVVLSRVVLVKEVEDLERNIQNSKPSRTLFPLTSGSFLLILLCVWGYISSDYKEFKKQTQIETFALGISQGDKVIVDSAVETMGWREFSQINIWFDYYFMFESAGIAEYRERWLVSCGPVSLSFCENRLFRGNSEALEKVMNANSIEKLVASKPLPMSFSEEKFKFLGQTNNKWSYEFDNKE